MLDYQLCATLLDSVLSKGGTGSKVIRASDRCQSATIFK